MAKKFPARLREAGVTLIAHWEVRELADDAPDEAWIAWACSRGYVCLTHDRGTSRDEAREEVFRHLNPPGALFILRGVGKSVELAERFLEVQPRIESMVVRYRRRADPFVGVIRPASARGGGLRLVVEAVTSKSRFR